MIYVEKKEAVSNRPIGYSEAVREHPPPLPSCTDNMDSASTSYTALGGAKKNAKKIPAEEAAAKHKSLFRRNVLLLIVSIVDVVVSFGTFCEWNGLYFWKRVVELPSQSFFLGWSSVDLWIVTLVKVIFIYWTFLFQAMGKSAGLSNSPPKLRNYGAAASLSSFSIYAYILAKCIARLISYSAPSRGSVPAPAWFWCLAASVVACTFAESYWLGSTIVPIYLGICFENQEMSPKLSLSRDFSRINNSSEMVLLEPDAEDKSLLKGRIDTQKKYRKFIFPRMAAWLDGFVPHDTDDDDDDDDDDKTESSQSAGATDGTNSRKKKKKNASIMQLIQMSRNDWFILLCAFVALFVAAIGQAFIPRLTGDIINSVAHTHDYEALESNSIKLVVAAGITAVFTAFRGSLFTLQMTRLNIRVREALFASLLSQELAYFDCTKTGKITSRLNADTTKLSDQISLNLNVFLRSVVQAILVLIFMFHVNTQLSFLTFISVPLVVYISIKYGNYYRKLSKACQAKLANSNAISDAAISSMSTVKYFASEVSEMERYSSKLQTFYIVNQRQALIYGIYAICYTALPTLVSALVLFYGGRLVIQGSITAGDLVSFMLYQQSLSSAFSTIGAIYSGLAGALGSADKVFELINRDPRIGTDTNPMHGEHDGAPVLAYDQVQEQFRGKIEFRNIVFRYPSRVKSVVLNGLNLTVEPGMTLALVGPSGGGKSSVLNILERLYEPEKGKVLLDGRPINDYSHRAFHRLVGIVGQEPVLFARSIADNIAYGFPFDSRPSQGDIEHAAKQANAHDFITEFPDGYDTKCGEKGVMLSGGQKQRIAIARALVRRPHVLLLDEATSALDAESENIVQNALDKIMKTKSRTVIVVAHRLSTIRNANCIAVIKSGAVIERGTHEELLKAGKDGVYSKLVRKQFESAE
jgi:ATP-binding cassette subfamily B (MDR/TAP) protein 9